MVGNEFLSPDIGQDGQSSKPVENVFGYLRRVQAAYWADESCFTDTVIWNQYFCVMVTKCELLQGHPCSGRFHQRSFTRKSRVC